MIDLLREEGCSMDRYVTGDVIRRLREKKNMTQEDLARELFEIGRAHV